ncbi:MAG: hypothetical protein Q7K43_01465 [Candidatus Woesearchaeota archaeon]|nr:hypothetical protein [Candidatus Woesearchaeota archaeon]
MQFNYPFARRTIGNYFSELINAIFDAEDFSNDSTGVHADGEHSLFHVETKSATFRHGCILPLGQQRNHQERANAQSKPLTYSFCFHNLEHLKEHYEHLMPLSLEKKLREDLELRELFFVSGKIMQKLSSVSRHYSPNGPTTPDGRIFSPYLYVTRKLLTEIILKFPKEEILFKEQKGAVPIHSFFTRTERTLERYFWQRMKKPLGGKFK